jgi:Flp pilus assembly protein TadG
VRARARAEAGPVAGAGDGGSALIEFVGLSVLLLIPLVYLVLSVFSVQRSAFGVTQAARAAGRAYATANSDAEGLQRAQVAAALAMSDQGVRQAPQLRFARDGAHCGDGDPGDGAESLAPGARFVVCVRTVAPLPLTGAGLFRGLANVTVNGQFLVVVDAYRAGRD